MDSISLCVLRTCSDCLGPGFFFTANYAVRKLRDFCALLEMLTAVLYLAGLSATLQTQFSLSTLH